MPVAFDTSGMEQYDERTWFCPRTGDQVSLTFIDLVPDLPASLDNLPLLRHRLAKETADVGALIEAHIVEIDSVPTLLQLLKLPIPNQDSGQAFIAAFTVPKATCSVVLRIQCAEGEKSGARESAVIAQVGPEAFVQPHPYAPTLEGRLPWHVGDEERWDGRFPEHPLSRARDWARKTIATARIELAFAKLPPFKPGGPGPNDHTDYHAPIERPALPPASREQPPRQPPPRDEPARSNGHQQHSGAHARPDPDGLDLPDLEAPALDMSRLDSPDSPSVPPAARPEPRPEPRQEPRQEPRPEQQRGSGSRRRLRAVGPPDSPTGTRRSKLDSATAWKLPPVDPGAVAKSGPDPKTIAETIGTRAMRTRRSVEDAPPARSSTHRANTPVEEPKAQAEELKVPPLEAPRSTSSMEPPQPPRVPEPPRSALADPRSTGSAPAPPRPLAEPRSTGSAPSPSRPGGPLAEPRSTGSAPAPGRRRNARPEPAAPASTQRIVSSNAAPPPFPAAGSNSTSDRRPASADAFPSVDLDSASIPGAPDAFPSMAPESSSSRIVTPPNPSSSGVFPAAAPSATNVPPVPPPPAARPGALPEVSPGSGALPGPAAAGVAPGALPQLAPSMSPMANGHAGAEPSADSTINYNVAKEVPGNGGGPGTFPNSGNGQPGAFPAVAPPSGAYPPPAPNPAPAPAPPAPPPALPNPRPSNAAAPNPNAQPGAFPGTAPTSAGIQPGGYPVPASPGPGSVPPGRLPVPSSLVEGDTIGSGNGPGAIPPVVPNGMPNGVPNGSPNGGPNAGPNGAPNGGAPNGGPNGGPNAGLDLSGIPGYSPNATGTRFSPPGTFPGSGLIQPGNNPSGARPAGPPPAVARPGAPPGAYPPGTAAPIGSPQAAGIPPGPQQQPQQQPQNGPQGPPAGAGEAMHSVIVGLPIGPYVPLWHEGSVSYWRMTDPIGVRSRLGLGVEARTEIDNQRFREAALFTPEQNKLFLIDRFRSGPGNLGGASTQLISVSEDEAYRAADDKALSELYNWIGDIVVAAGQRGEYVAIETGGWQVPVTPVVLIMLRTDGREWHSVVETSPVPVGAPVWRDQQPVAGDTQLLASPATDGTMRAAGLLTRFAVSTWRLHPFQLGLSFGPNPTLGDAATR